MAKIEAKSITEENFGDKAHECIEGLVIDCNGKKVIKLTTSKIRNLLSMVNSIYNRVIVSDSDSLYEGFASDFNYLHIRMVYEAGRDRDVKNFLTNSGLLEFQKLVKTRKEFLLFCRYFEALVAYHRFEGGQD